MLTPILGVFASPGINILNIKVNVLDGKTAEIEWSTDVAANGKIIFSENKDNLSYFIVDGNGASKYHKVVLGNLKNDTIYYYQILTYNDIEKVESFVNKFETKDIKDKISAQMSEVKIPYIAGTAAVVTWTTDEDATSVVEYGEDINFKKKAGDSKMVKNHLVILTKLKIGTQYYLRISSIDKDKNKSAYAYKEFFTRDTDKTDKEDLIISYLRPSGPDDTQISSGSITVSFKTNHYANGAISLSAKGVKTKTETLSYNLDHSAFFSALEAGKEYTISISAKDIFGKKDSEKFNVITKKFIPAPVPETGGDDEEVIVLGKDFSFYTPAKALYRVSGKVYSIINNMYFYITTPTSFWEYGYEWKDVKTVSPETLYKYPRAKLVTAPNNSAIYYLSERGGKISKIRISSPAVFNSYAGNKWENVVKVSQLDINAYPDVKLVKAQNDATVYYLENGMKRYVSYDVFAKKGFSFSDVMEVNKTHLDSYKNSEPLK
jgi:hypothetical protein